MIKYLVICLLCFGAGLAAGWLLKDQSKAVAPVLADLPQQTDLTSGEKIHNLLDQHRVAEAIDVLGNDSTTLMTLLTEVEPETGILLIEAYDARYTAGFELLMLGIELMVVTDRAEDAMDWFWKADLLAVDPEEMDLLSVQLASLSTSLTNRLLGTNELDKLDGFFESITSRMPEKYDYFLKLGLLRVQRGQYGAALPPLVQLQHQDGDLGEQARQLIADIDSSRVISKGGELALLRRGDQYVVSARVNQQDDIHLMVDTGAAMTVIRASVLRELGYLSAQRKAMFATAGGVVEAPVVTLDSLSLGNNSISSIVVGALPFELPDEVDGLLGMNFLRHYDFRIDQDRSVLVLKARSGE